jgi:hypothetical protein
VSAPKDQDHLRAWVDAWASTGPALQAVRDQELLAVDTVAAVQALAGAFGEACRCLGPRTTSGLVEQQRLLQHLRT